MAYWAYVQHPFKHPALLTDIVSLIGRAAERTFELKRPLSHWFRSGIEIERWLREQVWDFYPTANMIFTTWNTPRSGHGASVVFSSRYGGPAPEHDFIDIDALLRNVAGMAWEQSADYERPRVSDGSPQGQDAQRLDPQDDSAVPERQTPVSDPTGLIERLTEAASYIDDLKTAEHIPDDVQGSLYDTLSEAAQALLLQSQKIKEANEETNRQCHNALKALLRAKAAEAALSTLRQEHEALSDSHRDLASRLARSGEELSTLTQEVERKDKALLQSGNKPT
jgi:hypothetical protein